VGVKKVSPSEYRLGVNVFVACTVALKKVLVFANRDGVNVWVSPP